MTSDHTDGVTRRSVLRTGAATAGAVTIGAAGAAAHHDDDHQEGGNGGKRGGRALVEDEPETNEPFELSPISDDTPEMGASCMSDESATQIYLGYNVEYCNGDETTMYVHPNEAELVTDEVYEFRASQECKAEDSDNWMAAMGPSNQECDEEEE